MVREVQGPSGHKTQQPQQPSASQRLAGLGAPRSFVDQHVSGGRDPYTDFREITPPRTPFFAPLVDLTKQPKFDRTISIPDRQVTPPKTAQFAPVVDLTHEPKFGKSSPIRNPLVKDASSNIFNRPKAGQPRPEHHRPLPPARPFHPPSSTNNYEQRPYPQVLEIARPCNPPAQTTYPAPRPIFSTGGFSAVNAWKQPTKTNIIDLTSAQPVRDPDDQFNPDAALASSKFGGYDPQHYVDATQASENIKALLEGAFDEDDEDKPKARRSKRCKKQSADAASELADKVKNLKVETEAGQAGIVEEEEEEEEGDDGTVEGLTVRLLPHQIDGLDWMRDREIGERSKNGILPKGGILADDMGLGKTIQALSLILTNPRPAKDFKPSQPKYKIPEAAAKSTLVVAPLALIKQWESEIKTKVKTSPPMRVLVHHGPSRTRRYEDLEKFDIVITTYQTLTSEHADSSEEDDGIKVGCFGVHWYRLILDEAHSIKNRSAKMTQAAYALQGVYRWCLTGTPMQNNLDELQSLIQFLRIKPYNELKKWRSDISTPMKNGRGGLAIKRIQWFLKAFMKRRTKDVLKKEGGLNFGKNQKGGSTLESNGFKIVAREVKTITAEFSASERLFYERLETRTEKSLQDMMGGAKTDYIGALVLLLRLRQTCNHPDLTRGNLRREKEALTSGSSGQTQTPRKPNSKSPDDIDDVANMFGGLSVESKKCDICKTPMTAAEVGTGAVRCKDCNDDLKVQNKSSRVIKVPKGKLSKVKKPKITIRQERTADDDDSDDSRDTDQDEDEVDSEDGQGEIEDESDDSDVVSISSSTKITRLVEILKAESKQHKFIVFSEFTSMLDLVEPFLLQAGFCFVRYDGSMKNDDREASLESLRNNPKTRVLLCSLRCGSLGLNLTAASRVVILEPFWNPFVEEQAIDRVHRLNQTQDVLVYKLTIANSVEERILALQERKRELAKAAIEGGKAVAKLSFNDIINLFKPGAHHEGPADLDSAVNALGTREGVLKPRLGISTTSPSSHRDKQHQREKIKAAVSGHPVDPAYARRW